MDTYFKERILMAVSAIYFLDQGVIKHDQAYNFFYHQKLESSQYNVSLAITGITRETSREKTTRE